MKDTHKFRKNAEYVVIAVILLTIVTLNVSYSAFFQVKSLSSVKEISTGNLDVNVTLNTNNSIFNTSDEIFPMSFNDIIDGEKGYYSTLTIMNNSPLEVDYLISLTYDYDAMREYTVDGKKIFQALTDEELRNYLVSFNNLNIAIYDGSKFINFSSNLGATINDPKVTNFEPSTTDSYSFPILSNSLLSNLNVAYDIYVWLNENTPVDEIGKYAFLKIIVESETPKEAQ